MKKQKIPFYEKFDPVELWMWRNKKHNTRNNENGF